MGWRGTRLRTEEAGKEGESFDALRCAAEIESLIVEMTRLDPRGGCWEWVKGNIAEKWASLLAEMKRIDTAFERQTAGDIQESIVNTRRLFHSCITSWDKRNPKGD